MIFNMMCGGGGAGIDLTVVGGTTQPTSPENGTIWINTATDIGNTYLSAEEPTSPANGDVWICTDGAVLCTLTVSEEPTVILNICKLYQRQNGAWVLTGGGVMSAGTWYDLTANVYGIKRLLTATSPAWTRTDLSENFTATASVGSVAGYSDFDNCMPWKGMVRETLSTGDVMVKIPAFWYRRYRDDSYEYIQIADAPKTGFTLHPAFSHSDVEKDCIYVGAYRTSNGLSVTGKSPTTTTSLATARSTAKAKGDGWNVFDASTLSAIQMLYLVEYASYDSQSMIGAGYNYYDSETASLPFYTGYTDSVANLTGKTTEINNNYYVVYRGVENLWGQNYEFIDGIDAVKNSKSDSYVSYYVSNNPEEYVDKSYTNYNALNYTGALNTYLLSLGFDESVPWAMLPDTKGGSSQTGTCDYFYSAYTTSGQRWYCIGGYYNSDKTRPGLFFAYANNNESATSRLIYIPQ